MEQVRQKIKMQGFKSSKKADNKSVLSQVIPVFTIPGPHMCMTVFTMETVAAIQIQTITSEQPTLSRYKIGADSAGTLQSE